MNILCNPRDLQSIVRAGGYLVQVGAGKSFRDQCLSSVPPPRLAGKRNVALETEYAEKGNL